MKTQIFHHAKIIIFKRNPLPIFYFLVGGVVLLDALAKILAMNSDIYFLGLIWVSLFRFLRFR